MTSPSRTGHHLSVSALAYAERGWPVFPLKTRDKTPLTKTGFQVATTNPDTVRAWWRHWPDANIGLATGHAFDVLDVDGAIGLSFLRIIWDSLGLDYRHEGPVSLTGKGWHMLFEPTGLGNGANLGGDGEKGPDGKLLRPTFLDYRGIGGYIVAAPSVHPLGHPYRWDGERGPDRAPAHVPGWLLDLLNRSNTLTGERAPKKDAIVPGVDASMLREMDRNRNITLEAAAVATRQKFREVPIEEVCAQKGIELRRSGRLLKGLCPFHSETTPSFTVYPANDTFFCYGCNAYGDSDDLLNDTHFAQKQAAR